MKTHRDCQTTISLAINNCSKLEDSLDNLCSVEEMGKDNGVFCEKYQFFEFNDSKIENISEEKIQKQKTFGNSSSMESAYILIYKREKFIIDNPRDFYPNYPIKQYEKDFYRRVLHEVPRSPYTYVIDHQNKIITEIMPFSEYEGPKTDPQTLIELGYIRKEAEIESDCSDGINFGGDPFSNFEDSDSRLFENKDINSSEINQKSKIEKTNPYVSGLNDTRQNGRDTLAATVSFSGKQLPAFTIQHRRRKTKTITTDGIKRNVIVDRGCAGMNGILFQKWAVFFLKHASRGDVLILDNLGSHKNKKALEMLKNAGIKVCFTPPYSASKVSPLDNSFFLF
ncbi:transposase [Anaeramoeba flamelloides]|uniref:Transposase n=1 Tax=Anaeramoeba flamelloides TaxID=1746091 RepID=A0AAV7YVB3_9EUKA|nr:transposase [Anaeramoeba flamelloides]